MELDETKQEEMEGNELKQDGRNGKKRDGSDCPGSNGMQLDMWEQEGI